MLGVVYAVATVRSAPFFLSFFSFYYTSLRSVLLLFAGLILCVCLHHPSGAAKARSQL